MVVLVNQTEIIKIQPRAYFTHCGGIFFNTASTSSRTYGSRSPFGGDLDRPHLFAAYPLLGILDVLPRVQEGLALKAPVHITPVRCIAGQLNNGQPPVRLFLSLPAAISSAGTALAEDSLISAGLSPSAAIRSFKSISVIRLPAGHSAGDRIAPMPRAALLGVILPLRLFTALVQRHHLSHRDSSFHFCLSAFFPIYGYKHLNNPHCRKAAFYSAAHP